MLGSSPKSGKTKLGIRVHRWPFPKTFFGMEKIANERVIEARLPFFNWGKFQAAVVWAASQKRDCMVPRHRDFDVHANIEERAQLGLAYHV